MTPRQRVLAALNHRQPDRAPIDFGGHRSSGIAAIAYRKLRAALGLPARPIRVYDPIQQLAIIDEDVLDRFGVDTIELGRGFALEDKDWADWTLPDGSPCQMPAWALPERQPGQWVLRSPSGRVSGQDARRGDLLRAVLLAVPGERRPRPPARGAGREHVVRDASPPGPLVAGPDGPRRLADGAAAAARSGPIGRSSACSAATCWRPASSSTASTISSCSWRAIRERAHEFLDRLVEIHLANLEQFLAAVGASIDIIVFGDDLGMQNGPQMSPAMYREFFKPRHARMWRARQGTGRRQGDAPLLRRRAAAAGRPDRRRPGRHQSGADLLHGHGRRGR